MDEKALIRRLEELEPPEIDRARQRAKLAARVSLSQRPAGQRDYRRRRAGRRGFLPRRSRGAATGLMIALALALLAVTATGPGQALAVWVGQQVGLGRPGGAPSLHRLRRELDSGSVARGAPAYVLARGQLPPGGHYEFVGYRSNSNGEPCFELDLPATHNTVGGSCSTLLGERRAIHIDSAGVVSSRLPPQVSGRVSTDARSVVVSLGDETVRAQLSPVSPAARRKLGLRQPFKVFVAFLDAGAFEHGGTLTVSSRRTHGNALAETSLRLPDITGYDRLCKRLRLSGQIKKALESCA